MKGYAVSLNSGRMKLEMYMLHALGSTWKNTEWMRLQRLFYEGASDQCRCCGSPNGAVSTLLLLERFRKQTIPWEYTNNILMIASRCRPKQIYTVSWQQGVWTQGSSLFHSSSIQVYFMTFLFSSSAMPVETQAIWPQE